MDLVLCHTTADFDTLGAAVGAALLRPGSRIVLAGDTHPRVRDFLAIWRNEYPLIERRSVAFEQVRSLTLINASRRDRFSPMQDWLDQAAQSNLPIVIYDPHAAATAESPFSPDFPTAEAHIEAVGAATTLIVEALQQQAITPTPSESTVMALGIHSDTGSLTFEQSTPRDAQALAWLMGKGANQQIIRENKELGLSEENPQTAQSLMTAPVRTILPATSVDEAQRLLLRYGHSGLCVVNAQSALVGVVSRRDIDIALRHGLGHAPVKGCMSRQLQTITPETTLTQIQYVMMTHDIGRLPVLESDQLVGIVTRTDLLRQLHQARQDKKGLRSEMRPGMQPVRPAASPASSAQTPLLPYPPSAETLYQQLQSRISEIWPALTLIADMADQKGWALYLVGGAVRDLLLSQLPEPKQQFHPLTDIDLVVDGAGSGAGVSLAEAIQTQYPQVSVQVHGQFQTASLTWHPEPSDVDASHPSSSEALVSAPLSIDIATARTEFYPYPAANPEVEASTIRPDLYRRDFTVNAMAIRLNSGQQGNDSPSQKRDTPGYLLDYFGGWLDLQKGHVRVLHNNSFIEDPTRIFRAVRFAVRLGFTIEPQTEQFIRYAISSGVYAQVQASEDKAPALQTRLKAELKYMLSSPHWEACLAQISRLGALACLHGSLEMKPALWRQLRRMVRWFNKIDVHYLTNAQSRWLMLLELIIAQLDPALRDRVAINLDLDIQSQQRLKNLHLWEEDLLKKLPKAKRPSQIYGLLQQYGLSELLLMGDRYPYTLGPQIWQYIVRLSHHAPLINGSTLKQLGYPPGPQFKDILAAVHTLALDGDLSTAEDAIAYVLAHYPPNRSPRSMQASKRS